MRVDLYTDAGVKNRVATWATVAIVPGQPPIEASGRLRSDTHCTATAELRAIANALHKLITRGDVHAGDEVRILSDSRHAVDRIAGRLTGRPEGHPAKATIVIHKLAQAHGIAIASAWVPAHKPDGHSPHARWNNRCDALCRAARALPRPSKARRALDVARKLAGKET